MGKYSDMLAENNKGKAQRASDDLARRQASREAYESSGAAKQIEAMKNKTEAPKPTTAPQAGSLKGAAKSAILKGEGIWK